MPSWFPRVVTDLPGHLAGPRQQLLLLQPLLLLGQVHAQLCAEGHPLTLQVTCMGKDGAARAGHSFVVLAGSRLDLPSATSHPSVLALLRSNPSLT